MNTEYFTEMHKLIERAKNYEKTGREQEALAAYLEIHEKFFPNTSDLYERPAILLEKRKRFDEAIHICEKAIKLIDEGKITGIKDNFIRRIERIKARPDYIAEHGQPTERKAKQPFSLSWGRKSQKEVHKEHSKYDGNYQEEGVSEQPIVHRLKAEKPSPPLSSKPKDEPVVPSQNIEQKHEKHTKNLEEVSTVSAKLHPIPKDDSSEDVQDRTHRTQDQGRHVHTEFEQRPKQGIFHRIETGLTHAKNTIMHMKRPSKKALISIGVLTIMVIGILYGLEKNDRSKFEVFIDVSEFESTGTPIGNPFPTDLSDLPPITGSMIDAAVKSVSQMNGVSTAGVIVQKNVTGFVIMLKPGTSRSDAKNAAENFVKALGAAAASENSELSGPSMISYGSLYDYYGALVVAGVSPEDLTLKGVKVPKAIGFTWK